MTKTGIPEGKRRYFFTLTQKNVEEIHAYLKSKNAPKNLLSGYIDEVLADTLRTWKELEAAQTRKGSEVGLGDLLTTLGGILTDKGNQGKLL